MEKGQLARRWQAVSVQLQIKIFELMMINKMSELAHHSSIMSCFSQQLHESPANIVRRVQLTLIIQLLEKDNVTSIRLEVKASAIFLFSSHSQCSDELHLCTIIVILT